MLVVGAHKERRYMAAEPELVGTVVEEAAAGIVLGASEAVAVELAEEEWFELEFHAGPLQSR